MRFATPHKFRAKRTDCRNCAKPHPSKKEAMRCDELHLLLAGGEIFMLEVGKPFPLVVNGQKVATYIADFVYTDPKMQHRSGTLGRVVEDCKGVRTPVYRLKRKLMAACHGIAIVET